MNAQKAMKIVYDELKKAKEWQSVDSLIVINPNDFYGRLSSKDLWRALQKMAMEHEIIHIFSSPKEQDAYQFDRQSEFYNKMSGKEYDYEINIADGFYDFQISILKETIPIRETEEYFPFYMQVMCQAISELGITEENQPAKKEIIGWFNDNYPDLSGNDIKALSTFVRHPDKKQGGWHSNSKKLQNK